MSSSAQLESTISTVATHRCRLGRRPLLVSVGLSVLGCGLGVPRAAGDAIPPGAPLDGLNHLVRITESASEGIESIFVSTDMPGGAPQGFLVLVNGVCTLDPNPPGFGRPLCSTIPFSIQGTGTGVLTVAPTGEADPAAGISDTFKLAPNPNGGTDISNFMSDPRLDNNELGMEIDEALVVRDGLSPEHLINYFITSPAEPVPEPSCLILLGTGLLGIAGAARRKLRAKVCR